MTGSILPASSPAAAGSNGSLLAALNARAQIVENFIYPQLGASPQVIDASPTITVLAATNGASDAATDSPRAVAVNVSMKIGATGTLKIENGGLRLPGNRVVGNE